MSDTFYSPSTGFSRSTLMRSSSGGIPVELNLLGQSNWLGSVLPYEQGAFPTAFESALRPGRSVQNGSRGARGGYWNVVMDKLIAAGYDPTINQFSIGGLSAVKHLAGYICTRANSANTLFGARTANAGIDRGFFGDLIQPDNATKIFRMTTGPFQWIANNGPMSAGTNREATFLDFVLPADVNSAPNNLPGGAAWATAASLPAGYAAATNLNADTVTDGNLVATLLYAGGGRHRQLPGTYKTTTGTQTLTECTVPLLPGWAVQGTGLSASSTIQSFDLKTMTATFTGGTGNATGTQTLERTGYGLANKVFCEGQAGVGYDPYGWLGHMHEVSASSTSNRIKIVMWGNTPQSDAGVAPVMLKDTIETIALYFLRRGYIFVAGLDVYLPSAGTGAYDSLTTVTNNAVTNLAAVFGNKVFAGCNLYTQMGTSGLSFYSDNTHLTGVDAVRAGGLIGDNLLGILDKITF